MILTRSISVLLVSLACLLTSCASIHSKVKPKAAAPTAFLTHASEMKPEQEHSPFLLNWTNAKPSKATQAKQKLYIAPVSLAYLRPMSKTLANAESNSEARQKSAQVLANYAHEQFSSAFRKSHSPRYQLAEKEASDTLTLELALVELNPNTISGAVLRNGVNAVAVPGTDLLLAKASRPLKGNIAIEGRLRDSRTREALFEFSDNEESKSALIINVRDFTPLGQARLAIREWAEQFEQLMRTPSGQKVKDSSPMTLLLW